MKRDEFWKLIETHLKYIGGEVFGLGALERQLIERGPHDIIDFDHFFADLFRRSYTWQLWGAAYLINGGCSDDCFDYFRGWLIAMGRQVYEDALLDPDSLAHVVSTDSACLEEFLSLTRRAYETATSGHQLPQGRWARPGLGPVWDFDSTSEMRQRYPLLCGKFL